MSHAEYLRKAIASWLLETWDKLPIEFQMARESDYVATFEMLEMLADAAGRTTDEAIGRRRENYRPSP
jgi:hypothetical protein